MKEKPNYRVSYYIDDYYIVIDKDDEEREILFKGSLSDCEAYIRLNEEGYM